VALSIFSIFIILRVAKVGPLSKFHVLSSLPLCPECKFFCMPASAQYNVMITPTMEFPMVAIADPLVYQWAAMGFHSEGAAHDACSYFSIQHNSELVGECLHA
jgi:hypothetical protein